MLQVAVTHADHAAGPERAKVTVVEYGDFACAYCQIAYGGMRILLEHYGSDIRFIYRHFPLTAWNPTAELAAECAEAAAAQDKFWPMYRLLFERPHGIDERVLREYAEVVGLDLHQYDREMAAHMHLPRIHADLQGGERSHVRATPTFYVNGVVQDVTFGMERLQKAIDTALAA